MQGSAVRALVALATAALLTPLAFGQPVRARIKTHHHSPHICNYDRTILRTVPGTCRPRAIVYPRGVTGFVRRAIYDSAMTFEVPYSTLLETAECESGLNPRARAGPYVGLFQFLPTTFRTARHAMRVHTGVRAQSYWNALDASYVAAYLFASGGAGNWSCLPRLS